MQNLTYKDLENAGFENLNKKWFVRGGEILHEKKIADGISINHSSNNLGKFVCNLYCKQTIETIAVYDLNIALMITESWKRLLNL